MIDGDQPIDRHKYMAPYSLHQLPYITINTTRADFGITQTLPVEPNLHRHPYTAQSPGWTEAVILKSFTYFTVNIIFTFRDFIYFFQKTVTTRVSIISGITPTLRYDTS
jgi:hypothetical protein